MDPERKRAQRIKSYYRNRDRILRDQRERYASDPEYREKRLREANDRHRNNRKNRKSVASQEHIAGQMAAMVMLQLYGTRTEVNKAKRRRSSAAMKERIFVTLGNQCECCGETERAFLTIDHRNGDGANHRKSVFGAGSTRRGGGDSLYLDIIRNGIPRDKYRLLCMNCNWATRTGKPCPHEFALVKTA